MILENSIHINAAKEEIWPYMTEPKKILKWCITFNKFEYTTEKQEGVGITFYVEEESPGPMPVAKLEFKSTEWIENEKISFSKISDGAPSKYSQEWNVAQENSGSKFTFKEEIEMPFGILGRIIENLGKGRSESIIDEMLFTLKNLVESN